MRPRDPAVKIAFACIKWGACALEARAVPSNGRISLPLLVEHGQMIAFRASWPRDRATRCRS